MRSDDYRRVEKPKRVESEVRRTRAFGEYDRTAREAQRRAAAYGRAMVT